MTGDRPESKVETNSKDHAVPGWNLLDLSKPDPKHTKAESRFIKPPVEPVTPPVKPPEQPPKPPVEPPTEPPKPPIEPPKPPIEPPKPPIEPPKPPVEPPKPPVEPPKPPVEPPKPPVEPPKPPVEPPKEQPKPPRLPSPSAYFDVPEFSDSPKKPPVKPERPLTADVPIVPALPTVPAGVPTSVQIVPEKKIDAGLPASPEQRQTSLVIQQLPEVPKPKVPTGVFTGQGADGARADRLYKENYSTGEHATPHHAHLISKTIGLNTDIDLVGTGKDRGMRGHQTEMVSPQDPFHVGQWKYDVPGKTIIAGHVSFKGTPGPLYELRKLGVHNGISDTVTLESADGKKTNYAFAGRTILKDPNDQEAWNKVFAPGNPDKKELVMVTCCGPVDSHGLHKWRLIVHLNEVQPQPNKAEKQSAKPSDAVPTPTNKEGTPEAVAKDAPAKDAAAKEAAAKEAAAKEAAAKEAAAREAAAKEAAAKESAAKEAAAKEAAAKEAAAKEAAAKEAAAKEAAAKEAAAIEAAAKEAPAPVAPAPTPDAVGHDPHNSLSVIGGSNGTRFKFDFNRNKNNSLTAEIGGEPGHISYGTFGPNFSLINKDNTKLNAGLRIGHGTGLMSGTELPYGGVNGLTISGNAVFGQRLGRDTSWYLGGAFGAHPGNKDIGYQMAAETGFVQRAGRFSLRAGIQESKVDGFSASTYGIGGISYRADKNTQFDLTMHKSLTPQSGSGSDKMFFGVRHSF